MNRRVAHTLALVDAMAVRADVARSLRLIGTAQVRDNVRRTLACIPTGTSLSWGAAVARPASEACPCADPRRVQAATFPQVVPGRATGAPAALRGEGPWAPNR